MFNYNEYGNVDNPYKLLIFLHGYDSNAATNLPDILPLTEKIAAACLVLPQSSQTSDKHANTFQWFSLLKHDSNQTRRNPQTSCAEIYNIYNAPAAEIAQQAHELNNFIDKLQKKHNISNSNTYLIGFSQGAMMALYTGLSRSQSIGGIFALSGLVAGSAKLSAEICSYPPVYLYHGKQDNIVQYKTFATTAEWLQKHHVQFQAFTYPQLAHRIIPAEINNIAHIISDSDMRKLVK